MVDISLLDLHRKSYTDCMVDISLLDLPRKSYTDCILDISLLDLHRKSYTDCTGKVIQIAQEKLYRLHGGYIPSRLA
jgi:hypothetical protein